MPVPCVSCVPDAALAEGLGRLRAELHVPLAFPPAVVAAAAAATDRFAAGREDRRDLPFVTLDPLGSRDLDQAFALERRAARRGWTVWYAIADVAAFVADGGPVDVEARARGVTLYLPDGRAPLHPPVLSEGSASLLPGVDRPCLLWRLDVDADGALDAVDVRRALVRSRAQLAYTDVDPDRDEPIVLLREVGSVLLDAEVARGGVSLPLPEQVVQRGADGSFRLEWRSPLPVEAWNAQLSLLTGRAAGDLMLRGGVGLLRTLPPFDDRVVDRLRRAGAALGVTWPGSYAEFVRGLDPASATGAALLHQSARAMRGAGYVAFGPGLDGGVPGGDAARHAAVADEYAHVTAPLRRLADRFAAEAALSVCAGVEPPQWLLGSLGLLPDLMAAARQREGAVSRGVVDLAEALVLAGRAGQPLDAVVVGVDPERGSDLQLVDPPVRARIDDVLELGASVAVEVVDADPIARRVRLAVS